MKKIVIFLVTLIILFSLLLISCKKETNETALELDALISEIEKLEIESSVKDEEIKEFNILTNNLNLLLSTVYYGDAESVECGRKKNFTAFSIFYKDEFYLITAGHCIEYDGVNYINFKFKPNSSEIWISPELIYYENDYENNQDFAIFCHRSIRKGLIIDNLNKEPKYILGNTNRKINIFKNFDTADEGESGSPILNSKCKLVGIVIKNNSNYTPIEVVTEAIDKLNNNF